MAEWKNIVGVLVVAAFGGSVHQADNLFVLVDRSSLIPPALRCPFLPAQWRRQHLATR